MLRNSLRRLSSLRYNVRNCKTSSSNTGTKLPSSPAPVKEVTRESCLKDITDVEFVSQMDKRMLVFTRAYKSTAEIPNIIPSHKIRRSRDLMRVIGGSILTLMFIVAVPFYIASGKRARASGDTVWRQKKEWIRELRRKQAEEDAAKDEAINSTSVASPSN